MNDPKKLAAAALLAGGIGLAITGTANATPLNPPAAPPDPCFACHFDPVAAASPTDPLPGSDGGPFETLFGDTGINTWTTTADSDLAVLNPTLASELATSVNGFEANTYSSSDGSAFIDGDDPFRGLVDHFDPSAFSGTPEGLLVPDTAIGDFATGMDYTIFASGGSTLDVDLITLEADLFSGGL
jgi:hypothetical protein